jgi:hypothetical protein
MNRLIENYYPTFEYYQALRGQLLDILSDEDLLFSAGGENMPLGALCLRIGEVQQSYIDSFINFEQDFSYRAEQPHLAERVDRLVVWYADLDRELKSVVAALSDDDLQNRQINRGGNFAVSPPVQLEIYKEALLIFYGKADVYLKAMGKSRPLQWDEWIA